MKILAIRGKNLASLSAEFEIDFQIEPLASAGLYAITGPTGSGKSTLLDALCLALYERTPRLMKATTKGETIPDVGDNTVTPSDPRTILRRGAGEGYAEVDFVGSDGVSYRSRWSARRARIKADGKLQASEITLTRIADGQRLGDHSKTTTLNLIEACIGLSFDQFTRAVLLAQNDFATFLKAPDDERAELLQTLTGTETFSDISKQAFARMKAENETQNRLNIQLKDQQPLAEDVRTEKNALFQAQSDSAALLDVKKLGIEGHLRWYQQLAQRQAEEGDAGAKLDQTVAADLAAAPRQAHLNLAEQVQPARPLWSELSRLTLAADAAVQSEANAAAALAQSREQAQTSQTGYEAGKEQAIAADTAKTNAQPDIDKARALDTSISVLTPQFQAAVRAQADAQKHLDAALASKADATTKIQVAQEDLRTAQDWLIDSAQLRPLAEGWQRWEALFAQAQTTLASQVKNNAELTGLADQAAVNAQTAGAAQTTFDQATQRATTAAEALATLAQACAAVNADKLAHDKKVQEDSRDHLQVASLLWQRRTEAHAQHQTLQGRQQTEAAALTSSEVELLACAESQPKLEGELHSAEQAWHLAKLAASERAEAMRADLQPEQPCPVCGALEHPYASHSPVVDAVLQGLHDHVKACKEALRVASDRAAQATANKTSAAKILDTIARELAQLETLGASQLDEWAALVLRVEIDGVPEPDRCAWLLERQDNVRHSLEQLTQQEAAHRENLKLKEAAQLAVNAKIRELDQAKEALGVLLAGGTRINQAIDGAKRQLAELATQLESIQGQLDGAFADQAWRQVWGMAPEAFVAQCSTDAKAWAQQQERSTNLTHSIEGLQLQLAAAEGACTLATQQRDAQTTARNEVDVTLQGYRQDRGQLFEGGALIEVESGLNAAIAQAKAALEASLAAVQKSQAEVIRLHESLRQSALALDQQCSDQGQAQAALHGWLTNFNSQHRNIASAPDLSLAELQTLLAINPAWIAAERAALQAIQSEVVAAKAVLATRQHSLTEHEAAKTTSESAEALQEELRKVTEAAAVLTETLSTLKLDIARDDERLLASASLRLQIDQQAAVARVWSQLGELIGSADGKKFRNFAQQLTLDILLGYGNRHLQSLTRRYRLERIKDSLGLLVVDQDMGDEVRSVHSLSGGESFLVSLAMALGLASLSSHRVRVESLFIDEGFGSLDAESLRVAMDALDNLQAQGRKVGVISHVQEMTERIGTRVQVQRQAGGLSRISVC
jgi:DNA repair protein SbcC/Rad50